MKVSAIVAKQQEDMHALLSRLHNIETATRALLTEAIAGLELGKQSSAAAAPALDKIAERLKAELRRLLP